MDLYVRNKKFSFFDKVSVNLRYDSIASTFQFSAFFDRLNNEHKKIFTPLSYNPVVIKEGSETLLTGEILNTGLNISKVRQLNSISGYSKPGTIEDCEIPTSLYPLQFEGQSLKQISEKLVAPFGLNIIVDSAVSADVSSEFDVTDASESQTIKSFITELAAQKNIILSHNEFGSLLFTRAKTKIAPVASFSENQSGIEFGLQANGQQMHSEITVLKQASSESDNAGEEAINNPYVSSFRPKTKTQNSGSDIDTVAAAKNVLSNELKNIKLTIKMDRWQWLVNGQRKIIRPNNIISVVAPDLMISKKTKFFVESVQLDGDKTSQRATLTCVLPEVYNQETPKNIFT